jgi:hypothetical protein
MDYGESPWINSVLAHTRSRIRTRGTLICHVSVLLRQISSDLNTRAILTRTSDLLYLRAAVHISARQRCSEIRA